jgi:PPM family protein phosphatase
LKVAAATRLGPRRTNADAYLADEAAGLFAVADGMGDRPLSRLAAQLALQAARERFLVPWSLLPPTERTAIEAMDRLALGLIEANAKLRAPRDLPPEPTRATFAGVVVCGQVLVVTHVGDSRVGLFRRREMQLEWLTRDHTVLGEALRKGVPPAVAAALPEARMLTKMLGREVRLGARPTVLGWELGDIVLLCTDGVSDFLDADTLERLLLDVDDVEDSADCIVDLAIGVGGSDNATAVVVRWRGSDPQLP